jgi:hypothetical protein
MRTWLVIGIAAFGLGLGTGAWLFRAPALPAGLEPRWEGTIYLPSNLPGWEAALAEFLTPPFEGATLGTEVQGLWRGEDGKLDHEPVRPVIVSFPPAHLADFQARARALGKRLNQDAIYIRYERPLVELTRLKTDN